MALSCPHVGRREAVVALLGAQGALRGYTGGTHDHRSLENPFPGMNPWLQSHWRSAHASFITYARDAISAQLPPGLAALTEERLANENLRDDFSTTLCAGLAISESWDGGGPPQLPAGAAVAEPVMVILDKPVDRWIQIVDGSGHLITAVEVLSWTNKDDDKGRKAYPDRALRIRSAGGGGYPPFPFPSASRMPTPSSICNPC